MISSYNYWPFWWNWDNNFEMQSGRWVSTELEFTDRGTMKVTLDLEERAKVMIDLLERPPLNSNPDYLVLMAQRLSNRLDDNTELNEAIKIFKLKQEKD